MNFVSDLNMMDKMRTSEDKPWDGLDPNHQSRFRKDVPAGSVLWSECGTHLWYTCPCGCGELHCVPVKRNGNSYGWDFTGSLYEPTLAPSIQITTGCRWHGFLQKGVWIKA